MAQMTHNTQNIYRQDKNVMPIEFRQTSMCTIKYNDTTTPRVRYDKKDEFIEFIEA